MGGRVRTFRGTGLGPKALLAVISALLPVMVPAAPARAHQIQLVLRLKARVSMEKLAANVTDPRSSRYGRYYSPLEIRELAAPADADYSALLSRLAVKGFKIAGESKSHLFVTVVGESSLVESTFATRLLETSGRHRPLRRAEIPQDLALIRSVIGLDTTRSSRSHLEIARVAPLDGTIPGLPPDYIKSAYGFTGIYQAGYTGKGQHIAIATYDGYYPGDITSYFALEGISPGPSIDQIQFNGQTTLNDGSAMETQVDSEFSGMIAPGAQIHVFASAHNDDPGEVQLFTAILDDNRARVVNYSWGDCEANVSAQHFQDMNAVFARAVAQGVNIMVASGDWGAAGCPVITAPGAQPGPHKDGPGGNTSLSADWPAANPYVVAVGGTTVTGGDNGNVQETGWEQAGGGVSSIFPQPSWQSDFQAPFVRRAFPDIAFNADPNSGEPCLAHSGGSAQWIQIGGTSIAAPQWSGFMALVGEARSAQGALGFLNPHIYRLSQETYAGAFHDVLQGSNGGYTAAPGWDAVTGWGSPRASALLNYLRQQ